MVVLYKFVRNITNVKLFLYYTIKYTIKKDTLKDTLIVQSS